MELAKLLCWTVLAFGSVLVLILSIATWNNASEVADLKNQVERLRDDLEAEVEHGSVTTYPAETATEEGEHQEEATGNQDGPSLQREAQVVTLLRPLIQEMVESELVKCLKCCDDNSKIGEGNESKFRALRLKRVGTTPDSNFVQGPPRQDWQSQTTVERRVRQTVPGPPGPPGDPGPAGDPGPPGENGIPGQKGETGPPGDTGLSGMAGVPGDTGFPGKDGSDGNIGPKGDMGIQGEVGLPGLPGLKGDRGLKGDMGTIGEKGAKGDPGPAGPKGEPGMPGPQVVCLDDFLITETGNYSWPTTSAGAAHSQPCGIPRPREDGKDPEVAVRTCDSMGSWLEIDDAMCLTFIGKSFAEISFIVDSGNVTEENYKQLIQEVARLVVGASARDQTEENFVVVTDVLVGSAAIVQDPEVIVTEEDEVMTNILIILDTVEGWPEDAIGGTASRAVLAFERIIEALALQENFTQFTYSGADIHTIAQKINSSVLGKGGYGFSVHLDNGTIESIIKPIAGQDLDLEQLVGAVILPESLLQLILTENVTEEVSTIFTLYRQSNLFPVTRQPARAEGLETVVCSPVLGASVANQTFADLSDPVTILLQLKQKNATSNIRCGSYDFTLFAWTADGCETQVTGGVVSCTCNHLTNFGVLVDICTRTDGCELSEEEEFALEVTSIVGTALSLFGIVLTIVTLVGFKKLRERDATKFHVQLCLAIGCMLIVFVVGIDQTDPFGGCVVVSALIQYFTLASVMWMGAEALLMFQKLVIVFVWITKRYLIFVSLVCWLAPLIPVVIPLAINREFMVTYVDDSKTDVDFCFIGEPGVFFGAFLGPIIAIIVSNLVIFFIVIFVFVRHTVGPAGNRKEKLDKRKVFRLIVGISGVTFLFGITWLFGAFTITDASFAFQFLFALFNTLQGFFVFLFFCVLNSDAHEVWKGVFTRGHYKPAGLHPLRKSSAIKKSTPTSTSTELASLSSLPRKSEQMVSEDKDGRHVEKREFGVDTLSSKQGDGQMEGDGDKGATKEDIIEK